MDITELETTVFIKGVDVSEHIGVAHFSGVTGLLSSATVSFEVKTDIGKLLLGFVKKVEVRAGEHFTREIEFDNLLFSSAFFTGYAEATVIRMKTVIVEEW